MIDSHVHMGQFYEMYISPSELASFMKQVGVEKYAVSSTTICENNYHKVLDEFHTLLDIDPKGAIPVLWITSRMLADDKEALFIDSDIRWKCFKIHSGFEPDYWQTETVVMDYLVEIAKDMELPIMIHTGLQDHCEAIHFEPIISRHPDQTFILAHGRPIDETIKILSQYSNAFVDTAFMPTSHIAKLVESGLTNKVLWGSDSCIIKHSPRVFDIVSEYKGRIKELKESLSDKDFLKVTFDNAIVAFNLKHYNKAEYEY